MHRGWRHLEGLRRAVTPTTSSPGASLRDTLIPNTDFVHVVRWFGSAELKEGHPIDTLGEFPGAVMCALIFPC